MVAQSNNMTIDESWTMIHGGELDDNQDKQTNKGDKRTGHIS